LPIPNERRRVHMEEATTEEVAAVPPAPEEATGETVLVVDDSPEIARMVQVVLLSAGYRVQVAQDGEEALEKIKEVRPDLIILDVMMPRMDGFQLTRILRQDPTMSAVSIILLTAKGLSADRLEGLTSGADDYILKPFDVGELLARVRGVLRRTEELKAMSPLTGLPGNVLIEREIERRIEEGDDFAVLYADIDHFKAYNDRYGFARGDEVLRATAQLLLDAALEVGGPGSFVGHVGGDDFVVVTSESGARSVAQAAIDRFDREIPSHYDSVDAANGYVEAEDRQGRQVRFPLVSISVGISTTERQHFAHYAEAVAVATEMKLFTKRTEGSSWAIDSRTGDEKD
jgi:diguanylate cyclase (GGDEF)-like protein